MKRTHISTLVDPVIAITLEAPRSEWVAIARLLGKLSNLEADKIAGSGFFCKQKRGDVIMDLWQGCLPDAVAEDE